MQARRGAGVKLRGVLVWQGLLSAGWNRCFEGSLVVEVATAAELLPEFK